MIFGSLPSPSADSVNIGPLEFRAYGLAIALGVLVAVLIARRRWGAAGNEPDDIAAIAGWAVPAGLLGARAYHVATDFRRFQGRWLDVFAIWEGGLGIPGGLLAGVGVGVIVARRRGLDVASLLDAVAPAIPVAQAIGRLGNWFNQELYGRPSNLPWAVRIDMDQRPERYVDVAAFHPTFAYEALWNLALAGAIIWIGRRFALRTGQLFLIYVLGYGLGRLWVEALRIDEATRLLGVRINIWTSLLTIVLASAVLIWRRHPAPLRPPDHVPAD